MEKVVLDFADPERVVGFLNAVDSYSRPCTKKEIAKRMKQKINSRLFLASKNLAKYYKLVELENGCFALTGIGRQILRLTGNLRIHFVYNNLGKFQPFPTLTKELKKQNEMTILEIGNFISDAYGRKWNEKSAKIYGKAYANWLEFLGIGVFKENKVQYSLGEVISIQVPIVHEEYADKTLYDQLTQFLRIPKRIHKKPQELLSIVENEKLSDKERGTAFEDFIGESFWRLGFQYKTERIRGKREIDQKIFSKGSGDVALVFHFPISTSDGVKRGYVIACEAKATSMSIGSRTMGQIESFSKRIRKAYSGYLIHQLIISRSSGYDQTALPIAVDTVHLNHEIILNMLKLQETLLKNGVQLVTPVHIAHLIERLIQESKICPTRNTLMAILEELVDTEP